MPAALRLSTLLRATTKRGPASSFRRTWRTPGLTSHQLLDAGVAARQHAARKDIKRAKRPLANYFRNVFPLATRSSVPLVRHGSGEMSAYNRARLMSDPTVAWGSPWDVARLGVRRRGKRQDVLEGDGVVFGEDDMDRVIERLVDLRFEWDREDGVVATSLVPESLFACTAHCSSFSAAAATQRRAARAGAHTETVLVGGTPVPLRLPRSRSGHPKPGTGRPERGFTGADAVPALVLDVTHGPLVSSTSEPRVTLRWKADNRTPESVEAVLEAHRAVSAVGVVGLPPRSLLLLLKAVATAEVSDPALDVSLAIAVSENYNSFTGVECLEVLRCLRRIAVARAVGTAAAASASDLYDAGRPVLASQLMREYVDDAAPFLAPKVWARLPEQCRGLAKNGHALDWIDLLGLALEVTGAERLPARLPNPVTEEAYACRLFFLQYTLGLDGAAVSAVARALASVGDEEQAQASYVDSDGELLNKPLILWSAASLLVRLTAEALGDVLDYVSCSLHEHAARAAEDEEGRRPATEAERADLEEYLDRLALARPRVTPCPPLMGRRREKRMRVRLLPFDAFPTVSRCLPTPFAGETRHALRVEQERRRSRQSAAALVTTGDRHQLESPFATVLERSPAAAKHIDRASAALEWAATVLTQCHRVVGTLPPRIAVPEVPATAHADINANGENGAPLENAEAIVRRRARCDALARSRIQHNLDTLFTFIPWADVEKKLTAADPAAGEGKEGEEEPFNANAAMLEDLLSDTAPTSPEEDAAAGTSGGGSDSSHESASLTEAEKSTRQRLEELNARLSAFELAVADLLDTHERYFGGTQASDRLLLMVEENGSEKEESDENDRRESLTVGSTT